MEATHLAIHASISTQARKDEGVVSTIAFVPVGISFEKKLKEQNKKLQIKLKTKVQEKTDPSRQIKDAEANAKYWEEEHSKLQEEFEGKSHSYIIPPYTHAKAAELIAVRTHLALACSRNC